MKIVGFGDSFILGIEKDRSPWKLAYQGMIGDHFKCVPEFRGLPGSGPWNMFFDFLNYNNKDGIDVVIMAWSEIMRIYHPELAPINTGTVYHNTGVGNLTERQQDITNAARAYYDHLVDHNKINYECKALMMLVDEMTKEFPKTKFIHLPCFTWDDPGQWWGDTYDHVKPEQLRYYHKFKNGMEIRPALMYLSKIDEWPKDIREDRRECHMTPRVNRLLADAIIECIEHYEPGRLINLDLDKIK